MSALLERLGRPAGEALRQRPIFAGRHSKATEDAYQEIKLDIHRRIVDEMNAEEQQMLTGRDNSREQVEALITSYCNRVLDDNPFAVPRGDRARIVADICDEMLGLGPLEPLLKDDTVTEVMTAFRARGQCTVTVSISTRRRDGRAGCIVVEAVGVGRLQRKCF